MATATARARADTHPIGPWSDDRREIGPPPDGLAEVLVSSCAYRNTPLVWMPIMARSAALLQALRHR
jgi:hypothetical protein